MVWSKVYVPLGTPCRYLDALKSYDPLRITVLTEQSGSTGLPSAEFRQSAVYIIASTHRLFQVLGRQIDLLFLLDPQFLDLVACPDLVGLQSRLQRLDVISLLSLSTFRLKSRL